MIPCLAMQKKACPSYLFCNFHKRGSLEFWKKFTEQYLGGECNHGIFQLYQTDTNTGTNENILITESLTKSGSRFCFKSYIF